MRHGNCVESLVGAAKAGDREAFATVARRFRPTLLLVATGEGVGRDLAEDAVQDALLIAFRALNGLDDPSRLGPWLATIVRNRTRRLARGERRLGGSDLPEIAVPNPPPFSAAEEAIRILPEGIRESMLLFYLEDWSVGETAALLGRPVTTVKWQLHAGRTLLRKRLGSPENL